MLIGSHARGASNALGAHALARRVHRADYLWRLVASLALTQTVGYGVLYYSYSVFLAPMATDLRTSISVVTGALTVSLLAGAAVVVPVGRWLDGHGGRWLMTGGSLTATVFVLVWSRVTTVAELYAVWVVIGVASATVLYEAAFAVVISFAGPAERAKALLAVTIVAGFASSVFLPLAGWLSGDDGWRRAVLILALVYGVLTIPLHLLIHAPKAQHARGDPESDRPGRRLVIRAAVHDRSYWLLGCAFVVQSAAIAAVAVLLVSVLRSLGHSTGFAASVAGLLGILSVTGRLATSAVGRNHSTSQVTAYVFVVQALGAMLLPWAGRSGPGAIACVLAFGLGFGVSTIARPALLTERYGTAAYATLSATLALPMTVAKAVAPLVAAVLWHADGLAPTMAAVAGCALLGAVVLGTVARSGSAPDIDTESDAQVTE
ncbi:MAG TPA: MFS transporter [Actinocrinis sp.]|nr:MFS transporter [Actinocrinis sp.]